MLIDIDSIKNNPALLGKEPSVTIEQDGEHYQQIIVRNRKIEEAFGTLKQEVTYHFATAGRWSQYELMNYVLGQTGPAHVYFSTWKINDTVAANLYKLKSSGLILSLHAILEKRIPITSPEAKDLVLSIADNIKITDNHSKVIVIKNEHWGVVINGSANMTINPRIEAGTLCTVRDISIFTRDWILKEINHEEPFKR